VEAGASEPYLWYTMPLYKGSDLARLLKAKGCLSLARAHAVFTRIAGGVCEMHALGLRHQDIKPTTSTWPPWPAWLSIIRCCSIWAALRAVRRRAPLVATFPFAAPEQTAALIGGWLGDFHPPLTEKVDVYALATSLLFSLIGSQLAGHDIGQKRP